MFFRAYGSHRRGGLPVLLPHPYPKDDAKRVTANMGGAWIPVTERLPAWGQHVIVAYTVACGPPQREVGAECHYANGVWTGCNKMQRGQPTHWMPLPEPPQVE